MIRDDFEVDVAPGAVIGSRATNGAERLGVDAEGTMAVDNGALRIAFLERPGWGREALAYGPVARRDGLAMSVLALNGHNASQVHPVEARLRHRPAWVLRRLFRPSSLPPERLEQNFAVGWSDRDPSKGAPRGPLLMVSPVIGENADLCGSILGEAVPLLRRLRNVPILYVVVLRERGAVYYAASIEDVPGLPAQPLMRPLAVDPEGAQGELLATVHQSVLAESGWRVDTRVSAVRVDDAGELAGGRVAGGWAKIDGEWDEGPEGAVGSGSMLRDAGTPAGLLYARIVAAGRGAGFVWRANGDGDGLVVRLGPAGVTLVVRERGVERQLAEDPSLAPDGAEHLQVLDDGAEITVLVGARVAFGGPIRQEGFAGGTWIGLIGDGSTVADFEAHPRAVRIPAALEPGVPWDARGTEEAIVDRFEGSAGELDAAWVRRVGGGRILRTGGAGARVDADRQRPNPGRLVYTREWPDPEFAEISVEQTPPGSEAGEGENGRIGLVLMQDLDNYLLVNIWLDDAFSGTSISSFLTLDGHEDHFRAVWCNVGRMVSWGERSRLSLASDGMRWTALVDGIPVLRRALSDVYPDAPRLRIAEVGIAANWEYGDDTGTKVDEFSARRRQP